MADLSWTKCSTRKQGSVLQEVRVGVHGGKKVEQEARCLENPRIVHHNMCTGRIQFKVLTTLPLTFKGFYYNN